MGATIRSLKIVKGEPYMQCYDCGKQLQEDLVVLGLDGEDRCQECHAAAFTSCYACGCVTVRDEYYEYNCRQYCEDCYNERFVTCEECEDTIYRDESFYVNGGHYCESCYDELFTTCHRCDDPILHEDAISDGSIALCSYCYDRYYYRCHSCESLVHYSDVVSVRGYDYCERCAPSSVTIESYNYEPCLEFYGARPESYELFMGVELEIDDGGEDDDNASELAEIADGRLYFKHDGSLNDGFEVVSMPMTFDYHMNVMPWDAILEKAVKLGYKSHDVGTCGLHIHLSRDAFAFTRDDQNFEIAKFIYLFEKFWGELVKFSRRRESHIDEWCNNYADKVDWPYLKTEEDFISLYEEAYYSNRYRAVNVQNSHTVEVRLWRGTLNKNTFKATLQMTKHLFDTATKYSIQELIGLSWIDFIRPTSKYPELWAYLENRGLIPDEMKENNIVVFSYDPVLAYEAV